jgi:hypothetical protein
LEEKKKSEIISTGVRSNHELRSLDHREYVHHQNSSYFNKNKGFDKLKSKINLVVSHNKLPLTNEKYPLSLVLHHKLFYWSTIFKLDSKLF